MGNHLNWILPSQTAAAETSAPTAQYHLVCHCLLLSVLLARRSVSFLAL